MKLKGSITQLKTRVNASGDTVQTVLLEVFGDQIPLLHTLIKKPLDIELKEELETSPFEDER